MEMEDPMWRFRGIGYRRVMGGCLRHPERISNWKFLSA